LGGKELPTEAEWEFAARGGLEGAAFAWGDEHFPDSEAMANTWQGEFPWQNLKLDGFEATSPVGSFPPNGYGLFDMTGNVWEWTTDFFTSRHDEETRACCAPQLLPGGEFSASRDQGRLAPLRAELLPPLQAGRATRRGSGHLDRPHRLSVHRPRRGAVDGSAPTYLSATAAGFWNAGVAHTEAPANLPHV
jgi:hypothetical protein